MTFNFDDETSIFRLDEPCALRLTGCAVLEHLTALPANTKTLVLHIQPTKEGCDAIEQLEVAFEQALNQHLAKRTYFDVGTRSMLIDGWLAVPLESFDGLPIYDKLGSAKVKPPEGKLYEMQVEVSVARSFHLLMAVTDPPPGWSTHMTVYHLKPQLERAQLIKEWVK